MLERMYNSLGCRATWAVAKLSVGDVLRYLRPISNLIVGDSIIHDSRYALLGRMA